MALLIAASLQDDSIEGYSMAVAEKWKLGKKGKDNGILLYHRPSLTTDVFASKPGTG